MRFGSYLMAEYMEMFVISGIAVTFFLGGWHGPGPGLARPDLDDRQDPRLICLLHLGPRHAAAAPLRPADDLGWKVLLPLATLNVLVTAVRGRDW